MSPFKYFLIIIFTFLCIYGQNNHKSPLHEIMGDWGIDCEPGYRLEITGEEVNLAVQLNQIYIKAKIIKIKPTIYNIYLIAPDDLGRGGIELPWNNFSTKKPIAEIELIDHETMHFKWFGFYDTVKKEIAVPKSDYIGANDPHLIKCPGHSKYSNQTK